MKVEPTTGNYGFVFRVQICTAPIYRSSIDDQVVANCMLVTLLSNGAKLIALAILVLDCDLFITSHSFFVFGTVNNLTHQSLMPTVTKIGNDLCIASNKFVSLSFVDSTLDVYGVQLCEYHSPISFLIIVWWSR